MSKSNQERRTDEGQYSESAGRRWSLRDNCRGPCSSYDAVRVNDRDCLVEKQTMCTPSQQLRAWEKNVKPNLCGQPSPRRATPHNNLQAEEGGGGGEGRGRGAAHGKDGELDG